MAHFTVNARGGRPLAFMIAPLSDTRAVHPPRSLRYCHREYVRVLVNTTARDGHETSMAETETRRLQVSRRDRDVEMHLVIDAVVNKLT